MKFDVKVVHEYLKNNGIVYTVRGYEQNENFSVVQVNNVGHCMKSKVCKIESMKDLIPYVAQSGFKTAQDWYNQFKLFGHTEGWLYKVEYLDPAEEFKPIELMEIPPVEPVDYEINIIAFTGNRDIKYEQVVKHLAEIHTLNPGATWLTGMAVGLDLAVAQYAAANDIPFEAHLPFESYIQCSRWNKAAQEQYFALLEKASKIFTHSKGFSIGAYQLRNEKMANAADLVVSFNRHLHGGTVNMINYCKKAGIRIKDGFDLIKDLATAQWQEKIHEDYAMEGELS